MTDANGAPAPEATGVPTTRHPLSRTVTEPGERSSRPVAAAPADPLRPSPPSRHPAHGWPLPLAGIAVAYALAGWLGLVLAIPPGYASPIFPAAGIALAGVLVYGWPAVVGSAIGSFAINAGLDTDRGLADAALLVPAVIAVGAAAQAWLAATWLRRRVRMPAGLTDPRDIVRFLLVGALSCVVSTSVAHAALVAAGAVPADRLAVSAVTWFAGDALGVLIGAPIALTLIGRPASDWRPRRIPVGLPIAVATVVMALAISQVESWDHRQAQAQRAAQTRLAAMSVESGLRDAVHAAEAVRGALSAAPELAAKDFEQVSAPWLRADGAIAHIAYHERVPAAQVAAFEAARRAQGRPSSSEDRVPEATLRLRGGAAAPDAPGDVLALREIAPAPADATALALGFGSIPAVAAAIDRAIATNRPLISDGFVAGSGSAAAALVAIVQAVPARGTDPLTPEPLGVVTVVVRLADLAAPAARLLPGGFGLCLFDEGDATGARRLLHGAAGCEGGAATASGLAQRALVDAAGRSLELVAVRSAQPAASFRDANAWVFAMVGLFATAMFGALLLTVTGRTRRIEAAVRARTAQLEAQARERARAESALRDSEQRFRNIINTIPIGVVYTDLSGQIRQVNPKFCELLGYTAEDLMRRRWQDLTDERDLAPERELTDKLVRGELPGYRLRKRYVARDGRRVWVQSVVTALRDDAGRPRRIVGVAEDITEQLRLAEAERARETAEASNRAKSDFLSRMSHELRTPLNAMLGFAQLLELDQRHPLSTAQRPWVTQMQQAGWHLLEMINDVLDLSRIESGTLRLQVEPLDVSEQIDTAIPLIDREARRRRISISVEVEPRAARVAGDATRVKQILTNLLTNAVKYNRDGGHIEVVSRCRPNDDDTQPAGHVDISVSDSGLGMSPAQLEHLFQPFNRLGRERTGTEGTGIGLVISRRLAELMGGSLTAHSVESAGSTFVLTLPRAEPAPAPRAPAPQRGGESGDYRRRRVVYVEDNPTNVEVMRGILAQRPQVQLEVAPTAASGLAAIRRLRPSLVLLDMHLPDGSGMDVLADMRRDPDLAAVPVVVVSADAMASQIDAARVAGASAYLTKPVSVVELLHVLDAELEAMDTQFG